MEFIQLLKNQEVTQAALFSVEGELMNVIIKDSKEFHAGDSVACVVNNQKFDTKIIKKQQHNLYLYIPWFDQLNLRERRKAVRTCCEIRAYIQSEQKEIPVTVLDVSITGLGFFCARKLSAHRPYKISFMMEETMNRLEIMIQHVQETEDGFRYGCQFINSREGTLFPIRRYILKQQLTKLEDV